MDYKRHYNLLIDRAKDRLIEGYTERHHVIPKCVGGTNEKDNLVKLTAEEHYVAHQLLCKMYPGIRGLAFALIAMTGNPHGSRRNKAYGWIKRRNAVANSAESKRRWRDPEYRKTHSAAMKKVFANPEFGEKISRANTGRKMSDAARANIAEAGRNRAPRKFSEEAKRNMSEARKRVWAERRAKGEHLVIGQKVREARIKNGTYNFTDEHRANIGKAGIGRIPWNKSAKHTT